MQKRLSSLLIVGMLLVGCEGIVLQLRPRLADEGVVYLYLQPFPQEAERLRFSIDGISAISSDGSEAPLSLSLHELKGSELRRQRLLATGFLSAGEYSGFLVRTKAALLRGDGADSALLVPEFPVKSDFTFVVERSRGYVLCLILKYAESVEAGYRFSPTFSIFTPDRPPLNLMGFVTNSGSNDITLFNKKSRQAFAAITTGRRPSGMALDARAQRAYVAVSDEDTVAVIDILAGRISDEIRLRPGDEPLELALTLDGRTLLSANRGSNTVSLIDPQSRFEQARIDVGIGPRSVVVEQTGRRAFVFNTLSNTISVIDIPRRILIRTIQTDPAPIRGGFNRRGDRLYVIHEISSYVTVVDPNTLTPTGRFPLRSAMNAIKVDPNTDLVYLAGKRDFVVGVYDPLAFAPVDVVDTAASVVQMATDGDENTLYMVSPDRRSILAADRIRKNVVGEIDVGEGPYWVTVVGEN